MKINVVFFFSLSKDDEKSDETELNVSQIARRSPSTSPSSSPPNEPEDEQIDREEEFVRMTKSKEKDERQTTNGRF